MAQSQLTTCQPDIETPMDVEQFLTYRIHSLASRLSRQAVHILNTNCDLRLPEWRCMAMIGRRGKINLLRISSVAGMDRGQVTRSIQSLVEKGYVATERDATDRRIVHAMLTKIGSDTFQKMFPIMEQRQLQLLAAMSPSDQKAFYRIMDRLAAALDTWEIEQSENEAS